MPMPTSPFGQRFTDAARIAAAEAAKAAKAAKRAEADAFGLPELFVVTVDERTFTWELRRFGGVLLERGIEAFASEGLARADGKAVLASLCASPGLPRFKRGVQP